MSTENAASQNAAPNAAAPNAVVWFEIPAVDYDRAVRFYETVLDVRFKHENMPGWPRMAMLPYCDKGGVGGCIVDATPTHRPADGGPLIYLNAGDDLAGPLSRVEAAGGKSLLPKTLVSPEIGYIAHFIDSEGNRAALHSPR